MTDQPEFELAFPCEFPLKVIGKDEDNFLDFVIELVSRHVPDLPREAFTARQSNGGKYLSVSVTFLAQSRAQVDALYEEMSKHKRILTAL